jgi:hypothetical protein
MFQTKVVQKNETYILYPIHTSQNIGDSEILKQKDLFHLILQLENQWILIKCYTESPWTMCRSPLSMIK